MNHKEVKKTILMILYFPFQLIIQIILSPIILGIIACKRAENQAFEDVYMTKDNPWLNQEGPTMTRKKKHWWITRFIGLDCLFDD
jgi:hypothetical protein